ncbi:Vmc-like lipoprotein signal peptide domain-containing protein [Spiroplasma endosymbiont of Dilophus febrilis]|uniref:Vmc-like lipoprotein signal peptide domain-containing protein n=1 Tax=Spiroplasma endosymbiont of Dilophus febrilis TaxID=3066292 RepID=UPI00313B66B1
MKKLFSLLGVIILSVTILSIVVSCNNDNKSKEIEKGIYSISSIESPTKIIAKNPFKVDLTEVKNALKPQVFKELTKINNALTENDFDIGVWIFVNDKIITQPYDLTTSKFAKIRIIGYRKINGILTNLIPVNLPIATTS